MALEPTTHYPHKVYIKAKWADAWTEETNLFCDQCVFGSSGMIGTATFRWSFGEVQSYTETALNRRDPKELTDKYVKVEVTITSSDKRTWHGVFVDDAREYGGEFSSPIKPQGEQELLAMELTFLMTRSFVDTSFCVINDGTTTEEREVERGIPFNLPGTTNDRRIVGNCDPDGKKGPVFAESLDGAFKWSGRDILEYLKGYQLPKDLNGDDKLKWTLAANEGVLSAFNGVLDYHGSSLFDVLNMLMDRRRLVGWNVTFDTTASNYGPEIHPFTFNPTDLTLPGGTFLPGSTNKVTIDVSGSPLVTDLQVSRDGAVNFKKVIARGERVVWCGTMTGTDQFTFDWASSQESLYKTAAMSDAGYAALRDDQKHNANQEYRLAFERVYRYFKVKPEKMFDWVTGETVNGKNLRVYPPGARFLPVLPLLADADYTTPSTSVTASLATGSRDDYLPPIAFALDGSRYYWADELSIGDDVDVMAETDGRHWSVAVRMRHDTLGFIFDVSGGPQHLIAASDFTATDAADAVDFGADLDWKTFKVTVAVQLDNWAEAQWPDTPTSLDDVLKELIIYVPGRRMEYVASGTAFGLNTDGTLKTATTGAWIVDDSDELKDIARLAYEWYRRPRRTMSMTVMTLDCPYSIGQMVEKIIRTDDADLEPEVFSVITQITWNFLQGSYTIHTQFAELDAKTFGEL